MMEGMFEPPVDTSPQPGRADWRPLPAQLAEPAGSTTLSRRRMRSWSLVMESRRIPWHAERRGLGWQLLVPAAMLSTAIDELCHYENENRDWPPAPPQGRPLVDNRTTTVWALIAIGAFYNLTLHDVSIAGHPVVDWKALGNAHAGKILAGQWWRLATALTLHADWQHLLGNLLIGGFFISRLCRDLRSGLGWLLLLTAGMLGNLVNAWLQDPGHRAVGASTAIFGAVGILAAISMVRYRHNLRRRRRWLLPIAAALGLLAMLGASGENTDLGAHLFGFLIGLPLGLVTELLIEKQARPRGGLNALLAMTALAVITGAWWAALLWGS